MARGCCVPGAASPCSVPQLRTIPRPLCRPTARQQPCHSRVPASLHLLTVISGLRPTRPSCGNLVNKHERWPGTPRHLFLWAAVAISSPELRVSCCYFSLCRLHPFPRGLGSSVPVLGWLGLSAVRGWRWAPRGAVPRAVSPHQVPSRWLGLLPGSAEPRGGAAAGLCAPPPHSLSCSVGRPSCVGGSVLLSSAPGSRGDRGTPSPVLWGGEPGACTVSHRPTSGGEHCEGPDHAARSV